MSPDSPSSGTAPALLAVGTSPTPFSAAERAALRQAADAGLIVCLLDSSSPRAEQLAKLCRANGGAFASAAVIAASSLDTAAMMEAAIAFALEDAGPGACDVADRVFPPRAKGGLVAAISAVLCLTEGPSGSYIATRS